MSLFYSVLAPAGSSVSSGSCFVFLEKENVSQ